MSFPDRLMKHLIKYLSREEYFNFQKNQLRNHFHEKSMKHSIKHLNKNLEH